MRYLLSMLALAILASASSTAQTVVTRLRVATYNVMDFRATTTRGAHFNTVLTEIDPDILVVQEMENREAAIVFRDGALRGLRASRLVEPIDSFATGNALYIDSTVVEVLEHTVLQDRFSSEVKVKLSVDEYLLRIRATDDTVRLFTGQLPSGTADSSVQQRQAHAAVIRSRSASVDRGGDHFLFAGDLNVYDSDEPAFVALSEARALPGDLVDPLDMPGDWHSNQEFASLHTQSTRIRAFDRGASGGLDDRFDFILTSLSLKMAWREDRILEYTTFGNDGNHLNDSVNHQPNTAVRAEVAEALYHASDHLPVYIDLEMRSRISVGVNDEADDGRDVTIAPNPATSNVLCSFTLDNPGDALLSLIDGSGRTVRTIAGQHEAGRRTIAIETGDLASGIYTWELRAGNRIDRGRLAVLR